MILALLLQVAIPSLPPGTAPAGGPGPAQPPATMVVEPVAMAIAGWDADGDARTTRAEMTAAVARSFAALDPGNAGSIGYIAYADWCGRWLGDRNALPSPYDVDADGDDRITPAELHAQLGRTFDRLDRDRDGVLTHAELLTIRPLAEPMRGHKGRR